MVILIEERLTSYAEFVSWSQQAGILTEEQTKRLLRQAADRSEEAMAVARSVADLLTSDELQRVGQCADDCGCGWLFLDTSRNHTRRWCDIKACGNRAKAHRHYERKRSSVIGLLAGQGI